MIMPRFDLKSFNARKKLLRDQVVSRCRRIREVENNITILDSTIKVKKAELDKKQHKCQRLDDKLSIFFSNLLFV